MPRRNKPLTPPKRQLPRLTCTGKRRFGTSALAAKAALQLQSLHGTDTPHRAYLCTQCGKWHLTSK